MGWTPDPHRASDLDEIFASGRAVAVEAAPGRDHRDLASRHPADDRPPRQQHRGLPSGRGQRSFLRPPRSGFWKSSLQLRGERMADACDASFHGADGFDLVGARANPRGPSGQVSRQARTMTAARYAIRLVAALAVVLPVRANTFPECRIAGRTPLDDLPPSVSTEIRERFGPFSWPGGLFNPTDVAQPGVPTRRLINVWRNGERWVLAIEQGGRGYHISVVALDVETDRNRVRQSEKRTVFPGDLCATVADVLAGRVP